MTKTIKLDKTRSVTIETDTATIYNSPDEWTAEGKRRFGENYMDWKFVCPMCGHIASVAEFKEAGVNDPNCAYQECIGRYTGKGTPKKGDTSGCNWASYGLFGIPNGGIFVMKNETDGMYIFDFAQEKKEMNPSSEETAEC